jgi:hypothetical protein
VWPAAVAVAGVLDRLPGVRMKIICGEQRFGWYTGAVPPESRIPMQLPCEVLCG